MTLLLLSASCTPSVPPVPPLDTATPTAIASTRTPPPTVTSTPLPAVRVGGLFDLSGRTSALAAPYVDAIRRYIDVANQAGGVNGHRIDLVDTDYGYDVVRAVDAYKRLAGKEQVVAVLGWASADADALSPMLADDKMPYLSASSADILVDRAPARAYNFLAGATYAEQARALLQYAKDGWTATDRAPRVALVFSNDTLGRSVVGSARADAGRIGFEVADEQALDPTESDTTPQLNSVRAKKADFVFVNTFGPQAAAVAKDAAQIGLRAQLLFLNWGVDEDVVRLAGSPLEGAIGATAFSLDGDDRPGFAALRAAYPGLSNGINVRHVQGWLNAQLLLEGIRRAGAKVTGETIKRSLEGLRDYDTGGITAPISWAPDQHVGSQRVKLYQVRGGRWRIIAER